MVDARGNGIGESADFDFVVVTHVVERQVFAIVQPLLQFFGCQLRAGFIFGANGVNAHRNDFFF